jgi:rRNA maturation endonuclease Nob1
MKDVDIDRDDELPYECFECGTIVFAENQSNACPDCGGELRNRQVPLE